MDERSVISNEFPYIPIRILLNGRETEAEALLDTGFSGEVIIPEDAVPDDIGPPAYFVTYRVADNRIVSSPCFTVILKFRDFRLYMMSPLAFWQIGTSSA